MQCLARCGPLSIFPDNERGYIALFDSGQLPMTGYDVAVSGKTPKETIRKTLANARKIATDLLARVELVEAQIAAVK